MPTDIVPVSFPYHPNRGWTQDEIWGGTGGPAPDSVPDGTPAEVKKRLGQIVVAGATDVLKYLESKVFPIPDQPSSERPGTTAPGPGKNIDPATGKPYPSIDVKGKASKITLGGIVAIAAIGLFLVVPLVLERRRAG